MRPRHQDFVLGVVVIAFIGLFLATFFFVYPRLGVVTRKVTVRFPHDEGVAPLKVGSVVMLSGALQIGEVTEIRTETAEVPSSAGRRERLLIVVDMKIDQSVTLYEDCQITTDQPPVGGGGMVVVLNVGTPGRPVVGDEPILGLPPQSFAAAIGALSRRILGPEGLMDKIERTIDPQAEGSLTASLHVSLRDLNAITAQLRGQLSPDEERTIMWRIQNTLANIDQMSAALRDEFNDADASSTLAKLQRSLDQLNAGLSEATALLSENRAPIGRAVGYVEDIARTASTDIVKPLANEFNRDDPASLLGKLHTGMNSLTASLDNVVVTTDAARQMVVLSRPGIEATVANFKSVSDQMATGIQQILLQPWRLLKQPEGDLTRLDVFEAARNFADAATKLDDATARLDALVKADQGASLRVSDAEFKRIREGLREAFERFQRAETFLYEKMK